MKLTTTYKYKFNLIDSTDKILVYSIVKVSVWLSASSLAKTIYYCSVNATIIVAECEKFWVV